jgi:hypothetical protein
MKRFAALVVAALLPATASAAALPFGLDKLHWTMSRTEAVAAFAPLQHPVDIEKNKPRPGKIDRISFGGYAWQSCHLGGPVFFDGHGLVEINLADFDAGPECASSVFDALTAAFGPGRRNAASSMMDVTWSGADTNARYVWSEGFGAYVYLWRTTDLPPTSQF